MTTFSYDGTIIQTYTVPTTGKYDIIVDGAQGGAASGGSGGEGAAVSADVILTAGTVLDIVVGGAGTAGAGSVAGGGGGGSFVVQVAGSSKTALVVAGGGGGAGDEGASGTGGQLPSSGNTAGGSGATEFSGGGGGGGFTGNGGAGSNNGGSGGSSFTNGAAGGESFEKDQFGTYGDGGFGGGGGSGFSGGGGGGYDGGAGAGAANDVGDDASGGAGGGSYVTPAALSETAASGVESGNGSVSITLVCFAAGTAIRTVRGDVNIEHLGVGDLVVTASGDQRPIRWLGHRTLACRTHHDHEAVMPVRVAAGAFGPDRPRRDLYVSPAHAICVDVVGEALIPAGALINGSTICQVDVDEITYWHVELDSHDVLLADNLPAESYLDCGNRRFFHENEVTALAAVPDAPGGTSTHPDFCRPFHVGGTLVDAVRAQLRARAVALGWTLNDADDLADLHLVVDGIRIDPVTQGLAFRFAVPAGARDAWLVSTSARPIDVCDSTDRRQLGVCLAGLTIDEGIGPVRRIDQADPRLDVGFHEVEPNQRWTRGRARLPAAHWDDSHGTFTLCVDLAAPGLPRWVPPPAVKGADGVTWGHTAIAAA